MLDKSYDFKKAELKWKKFWENNKTYQFNPDDKNRKKIYSIDTPPPTVSGKMHIGHAFSYSQQDFIIRYKRMKGFNVFYPFGTDDNGLPTEKLIEKIKKVKSKEMKREDFVKLCLQTLKEIRPGFIDEWKRIGISSDFNIIYSTIDDRCRKIAQQSFLELYKAKRIYKKEAAVIFCPECQTAISQTELKDKEISIKFNDIVFKVAGTDLIIATTRPELLSSCVAVFYHPSDKRYKHLKGKKAKVPLFNFEVPILADEKVDINKGTGAVMCCTFGDLTDIEWQKAHKLPIKISINKKGEMSELAGKYKGMKIKEARKKIIEDLKKENLLHEQKDLIHNVNTHERCNTEIEFLMSEQWFVKYLDLKNEFLKQGKKIKWHPDFMVSRYNNWIKGLQWDWCISRQRFFGVPFPVWYCKKCKEVILADEKDLPIDPLYNKPKKSCKCGSKEFEPEKDVLDTWFTSSLTPQLCIDRAEAVLNKKLKEKLFPMDLRPQAHDIITFWAFNTIVKSYLQEEKKIPWKDVMVSGFVTLEGEKMSKSKGNVIEPQEVIEKFGSDALRFWAAASKLGKDLDYQEKDLITAQKFITKLWNASRFLENFIKDNKNVIENINLEELMLSDRWILAKLTQTKKEFFEFMDEYEISQGRRVIEFFFKHEFCDFYIEMIKHRLYADENYAEEKKKDAALKVASYCLRESLKMLSIFIPFVCEEIYQNLMLETEKKESVHLTVIDEIDKKLIFEKDAKKGEILKDITQKIRDKKQEKQMGFGSAIENAVIILPKGEKAEDYEAEIKGIGRISKISFKEGKEAEVEFL
ncbi:valine--tRNA ligase [Candidatus Pacearchaeota archaeon CG_4_10_14_0_2_um_filter_31_10]|nr:MAG: valine--tRNA ligase [Candidatus Pacearchaeota archaeon CG_4_10_14_0_2_um_filter_31_10]